MIIHQKSHEIFSKWLLFASAMLLLNACGPASIGSGIASLAESNQNNTVVFLLQLSNPLANPLRVRISDAEINLEELLILPGTQALVTLPTAAGTALRVCAQEEYTPQPGDATPLVWDYDFVTQGSGAISTFNSQSQIVASLFSTTSSGSNADRIEIHRLSRSSVSFAQVANMQLDFEPVDLKLHPSGAYLYALAPIDGTNDTELRSYRISAIDGTLEEFTSSEDNTIFSMQDEIEIVISANGRFLYTLAHDDSALRSTCTAWQVLMGGQLQQSSTFIRGRIQSFSFIAGDDNAFIGENFGSGFVYSTFRIDEEDGSFDFPISQTGAPCNDNSQAPSFSLDPSQSFLYIHSTTGGLPAAKFGSYQLFGDGSIQNNNQCLNLQEVRDLTYSTDGDYLYITGPTGILTYAIGTTGSLTLQSTQTFGASLGELFSENDPSQTGPLANLVYVALGDTIVPHSFDSSGTLTEVTNSSGSVPSLPFGSGTSTRLVQSITRGLVTHENN